MAIAIVVIAALVIEGRPAACMRYRTRRCVAISRRVRWLAAVMAGLVALATSVACHARVILGASSAYSQAIHLDLTQTTALPGGGTTVTHQIFSSGPIPSSSGVAPDRFDTTNSEPSTSVSFDFATSLAGGRFLDASTGRLLANANADVDGASGERSAFSLTYAYGAAFAFFMGNFISFSADSVSVGAGAVGDFGSLLSNGVTILRNAEIDLFPLAKRALPSGPEANTAVDLFDLYGLTGITMVLNEHLRYGDGITSTGVAVNGVHLHFDNFVIDPSPEDSLVLNGDFIIGHAEAELRAVPDAPSVPEPGLPALVAVGLAAAALRTRTTMNVASNPSRDSICA